MKRIILLLLMFSSLAVYAQKTDLSTVNTVKPKKGQKMAFEAAYKAHIAKFHKASENINVYEIMSGPNAGMYHLVNGGRSYADFDKERADATAHSQDLDKTFFPYLEETVNATFRIIDSMSLRPEVVADKYVVNVRHMNQSLNLDDYRKEWVRTVAVQKELKTGFWENLSYATFEQLWDGSDQVIVSIRNLKDGFKSLEMNYFGETPPGSPSFRDVYSKKYGNAAWDNRVKVLDKAVDKTDTYIMRLRKDLSSQQ